MAMGVGPGRGIKSDINVTPLVDVVLVLLIIFMVVTPMLQRGKDVVLPKAHAVEKERAAGDPIVVSVTKDTHTFIEHEELSGQLFEETLRSKLLATPGKPILLKGDSALQFEDIRKVLERCRNAGAKGISLGVEEIKK